MDSSTLDAFLIYVDDRLRTDHGDTQHFRDSVLKMAATFAVGTRENLRLRIIDTCLDTGLLNCPADTFTSELRRIISEVLIDE